MTLKTFTIKKLFHKYDVTIRCDEKCVILLGVNGVGKTTALRLLKNYMDDNFIDICSAPFDSIDVEYVESPDHNIIDYYDLFPKLEVLTENYKNHRRFLVDSGELNSSIDPMYLDDMKTPDEMAQELYKVLVKICDEKRYGEFVYNLYKKKPQPLIIQRIIDERLSYEDILNANIIRKHSGVNLNCFEGCQFVEEDDLTGNWLDNIDSIFFNAVENCVIENTWALRSSFVDDDIEWIKNCPSTFFDKNLITPRVYGKEYRNRAVAGEDDSNFDKLLMEIDDQEKPLRFPSGFEKKEIIHKLIKENVFELNRLINRYYFDDDFIIDINNKAKKYVDSYYELKSKDDRLAGDYPIHEEKDKKLLEEVTEYFTDDMIRDYYEYLRPILIKDSFFDFDIEFRTDPQIKHTYDLEGIQTSSFLVKRILLKGFMNEVMPLLKAESNRSDFIKKYEEVISKYLNNKFIVVKPCGIQIKESAMANQNAENQFFVLYNNEDVDLSVISSGEKKLLIIFAIAIFSDGVLFVDEPELSLSLLWQESLIPDILHYGNISHLYIATHSPYISRDDELEQYLYYLPQRNA